MSASGFCLNHFVFPVGINNVILGAVYHPNNDDNTLHAHIFEALDKALTNYPNSAIILAGDFNKFTPGNLCSSFKLKQLVDKPTCGSNILDKIYTSVPTFYDKVHILPPIETSDHSSVLLSLSAPSSRERIPKKLIQFRACNPSNKAALQRFLNTYNWSTVSDLESCMEKLDCFMSIVQLALNIFIPIRTVKIHHNDNHLG